MLARIGAGVAHLNAGELERALTVLQEAVGEMPEGVSSRYEAGCRYNLGLAYRRAGREKEANLEFRRVLAADQNSLFATGARAALRQSPPAAEEETAPPEPPVGHR
jgi:Flp pilus assembly protein TadD